MSKYSNKCQKCGTLNHDKSTRCRKCNSSISLSSKISDATINATAEGTATGIELFFTSLLSIIKIPYLLILELFKIKNPVIKYSILGLIILVSIFALISGINDKINDKKTIEKEFKVLKHEKQKNAILHASKNSGSSLEIKVIENWRIVITKKIETYLNTQEFTKGKTTYFKGRIYGSNHILSNYDDICIRKEYMSNEQATKDIANLTKGDEVLLSGKIIKNNSNNGVLNLTVLVSEIQKVHPLLK